MHKLANVRILFLRASSLSFIACALTLPRIQLFESHAEELALLEAHDSGKPLGWASADVADAVVCLRYYAGWADKIVGQSIEVDKTKQ